jgi:hypothetical protein
MFMPIKCVCRVFNLVHFCENVGEDKIANLVAFLLPMIDEQL